jgi:DNA mismatch repair protein MutS2
MTPDLVPDLLHPTPMTRIDAPQAKLSIALAFASGVSGGLFADALDRTKVASSTWEPASFANDLFLQNFVSLCFKIRIGDLEPAVLTNHLVMLLAHPPADPDIVEFRRAILKELTASPGLRKELERLYGILGRFRTLLEGATGIGKWDANRRQLDVLVIVKEIVDCMAERFVSSASGLSRLTASCLPAPDSPG